MIRNPTYEKNEVSTSPDPSPGQYDGHLKPFGADVSNRVPFGDKYKPEKNFNPGPGQYENDDLQARNNSPSMSISKTKRSINTKDSFL